MDAGHLVTDLAMLAVVAEGDDTEVELARRLRESGLDDIGDLAAFASIRRLFDAGALTSYVVTSRRGTRRTCYGISDAGRDQLAVLTKRWLRLVDVLDRLVGENPTTSPGDFRSASSAPEPPPPPGPTAARTVARRRGLRRRSGRT
ncbi:MAG: PadR family transcriptional regulator [Acidimicrobiales bacterium]